MSNNKKFLKSRISNIFFPDVQCMFFHISTFLNLFSSLRIFVTIRIHNNYRIPFLSHCPVYLRKHWSNLKIVINTFSAWPDASSRFSWALNQDYCSILIIPILIWIIKFCWHKYICLSPDSFFTIAFKSTCMICHCFRNPNFFEVICCPKLCLNIINNKVPNTIILILM